MISVDLACSCNKHILGLGQRIKKSLTQADITGYQFGTCGVSDGISMGTFGMSYSVSLLASCPRFCRGLTNLSNSVSFNRETSLPTRSSPPPEVTGSTEWSSFPVATRTCPERSWPSVG